jgi:hypothetical protein
MFLQRGANGRIELVLERSVPSIDVLGLPASFRLVGAPEKALNARITTPTLTEEFGV